MPVGIILGSRTACCVDIHYRDGGVAFQGVCVCVRDVGSARKFMNRLKE